MCGINGVLGLPAGEAGRLVRLMNEQLAHRGPDDQGVYTDDHISLGHRRLSIIDLSASGHQPMTSHDQNLHLVFNGEIYNYRELKQVLDDYPYTSGTDSEVILAAYQRWGIHMLPKLNGMFAFALWDAQNQQLLLARDRLGIKPLYYYHDEEVLVFASEIRALLRSGVVKAKVGKHSVADYLRYQTVHAPDTMIEQVHMLMPGHYLLSDKGQAEIRCWWDPSDARQEVPEDYQAVCEKTRSLFFSAVSDRLVSDVPFGAFLSGGIDSAAVVAAMAETSSNRIKTFNVAFAEDEFSEAGFARMVANKFNTEHHEILLSANEFLHDLPSALNAMDHPGGDGPNTWIVSRATRKAGITMALSGLGGDELFAGYEIFRQLPRLQDMKWLLSFPLFLRKLAGVIIKLRDRSVSGQKTAEVLAADYFDLQTVYPLFRQVFFDKAIAKLTGASVLPPNSVKHIVTEMVGYGSRGFSLPYLSKVSVAEMYTYMQNVLLRDTDQMSMAHALEVRVPFLDYRLVEWVLSVKDEFKYPYTPKKLLVDSLGNLLPPEIVNRPKMGFTLPWKEWMKKELYEFCDSRLKNLGSREGFNDSYLQEYWRRFQSGDPRITWSRIWPLVVLEDWLEKNNAEII